MTCTTIEIYVYFCERLRRWLIVILGIILGIYLMDSVLKIKMIMLYEFMYIVQY